MAQHTIMLDGIPFAITYNEHSTNEAIAQQIASVIEQKYGKGTTSTKDGVVTYLGSHSTNAFKASEGPWVSPFRPTTKPPRRVRRRK